jgi:hypothetical protein
MSKRTNLVLLAAIATALVTTGCPATKKITNPAGTGEGTLNGPVIKGEAITPSSLKGTVMLPAGLLNADGSKLAYQTAAVTNGKAVAKARVYVADYRLKEVPDTGDSVTDAAGKFLLKPVPANNVWVIRVDLNGYTLATMAVPVAKKELDAPITLATTIAAAGVYPLFTEAATPRYLLNDLDLSLFLKLSEAINAMLDNNTTIKPKKSLTEMTDDFTKLMGSSLTGGAEVKKAYEAITKDLKTKAELRRSGFANRIKKPEATVPGNGGTDTTGGTGGTGGTDTTGGTETASLEPVLGTLSDVKDSSGNDIVLNNGSTVQMAGVVGGYLAIPDGNRVLLINSTKNMEVKEINKTNDNKSFSEATNLVVTGTGLDLKAYMVVKIDGDFHLVSAGATSLVAGGTPKLDSAKKLVGNVVSRVASLISLNSTTLLAFDDFAHVVAAINVDDAKIELFSGLHGVDMAPMSAEVSKNDWRYKTPVGAVKDGESIYIAEKTNNQIDVLNTGNNMVKRLIGVPGGLPMKSGVFSNAAVLEWPTALAMDGTKLYMVSEFANAIQVADMTKEVVVSLATEATKSANGKDMVRKPTGIAMLGGALYVLEKEADPSNKRRLRKFTFTSP